jgi:hypothetical protein
MKESRRKFVYNSSALALSSIAAPLLGMTSTPKAGKLVQIQTIRFCCDKTTEEGADEIIMYVVATCSQKNKIVSYKFPDNSIFPVHNKNHIDMNDGNQPNNNRSGDSHCIDDGYFGKNIFKEIVYPGDRWEIAIFIVEEDGGTTATAQEVSSAILIKSGDPYAMAAGAIIGLITKFGIVAVDSNDYIGSIGATVRAEADGNIASGFNAIERVQFYDSTARHLECRFRGDGSDYLGEFKILIDGV